MQGLPTKSRARAATPRLLAALVAAILGVSAGLIWLIDARTGRRAAPSPPPPALGEAPCEVPLEPEPPRRAAELLSAREAPLAPSERAALAASPSAPGLERERTLLASSNPRLRYEGLRLLTLRRSPEALPAILDFLEATRDSEPELLQRISAVRLLGELEGVSTGPELRALYEDEGPGIRRAAAKALEAQGDASLVWRELDGLRAGLASPDGGLRARAAEEAARLASPLAIPALLPLLTDENSEVRAQAVDGLWLANDPTFLPELRSMLADPVERVRERAQRAIQALSGGG